MRFAPLVANGHYDSPRFAVLEVHDRMRGFGEPIAWILVSRHETIGKRSQDGDVLEASITVAYQQLNEPQRPPWNAGWFAGGYSRLGGEPMVSISSRDISSRGGAVLLDLHGLYGQRIGTCLLHEVVSWVKQWPAATVNRVQLQASDAHDTDNFVRRNRLYEKAGLRFESDDGGLSGYSLPMPASELRCVETWKQNIRFLPATSWIQQQLVARTADQEELAHRGRILQERNEELRGARGAPWRWALAQSWRRFLLRLPF